MCDNDKCGKDCGEYFKKYFVKSLPEVPCKNSIYIVKTDMGLDMYVTNITGVATLIASSGDQGDVNIMSSGSITVEQVEQNFNINVSQGLQNLINNSLQPGDNITALINNAGYVTEDSLGTAAYNNTEDFATNEQGVLADTSLQPNDNISLLTNDVGYITEDDLVLQGLPSVLQVQNRAANAIYLEREDNPGIVTFLSGSEIGSGDIIRNTLPSGNINFIVKFTGVGQGGSNVGAGGNANFTFRTSGGEEITANAPIASPDAINNNQLITKGQVSLSLSNKADLVGGFVPSSQLPSYVDDVLEFPNLGSFPTTGETGKIYISIDTNKTYRWTGSVYASLGDGIALGETSATAYRGDRGKIAYDHSQSTGNPHNTQIADISGLVSSLASKAEITNVILTTTNQTKTGTLTLVTPNRGNSVTPLAGLSPLIVSAGKGSNSTQTSGTTSGGNANEVKIGGGYGGDALTSSDTNIGGSGGDVYFVAGDGGLANGGTANFPGKGGDASLQAGDSWGGIAGKASLKGGNNRQAVKGGNVYIVPGYGNNTDTEESIYNGTIFIGASPNDENIRGNTVFGTFVDNGVDKVQIKGNASGTLPASNSNHFTRKGEVDSALALKANDSDVLHKSIDEIKSSKLFINQGTGDMPILGSPNGTKFLLSNGVGTSLSYGLSIGVKGNGNTILQSQRFDGDTSVYNIELNTLGGFVIVPNGVAPNHAVTLDQVTPNNIITSDLTYTLPTNKRLTYLTFKGTTSIHTLPPIATTGGIRYMIINRGSGNITVNSNAGGNDIDESGVLMNTYTIPADTTVSLFNNTESFIVINS